MNAETTAQTVKDKSDLKLKGLLPGAEADAFRRSARVLMEEAEERGTDKCLALRVFNNLINGQISWRARDIAEQHIRECLNCLELYTAFQEMIRLRKDSAPLESVEVENLLKRLGLKKPKGLLARLRG